jgi:hypothetical protein
MDTPGQAAMTLEQRSDMAATRRKSILASADRT